MIGDRKDKDEGIGLRGWLTRAAGVIGDRKDKDGGIGLLDSRLTG
jgi:hypothetical protein